MQKVVADVNSILGMTEFPGRVDSSNVQVSVKDSGILEVKVECILCNKKSYFVLAATKYSVEVNNWKRHLSQQHLVKGSALQKGVLAQIATKSQPSMLQYVEKPGKPVEPLMQPEPESTSSSASSVPGENSSGSSSK